MQETFKPFKSASVVGLGISGAASVGLLHREGFEVTGMDEHKPLSETCGCDARLDILDEKTLLASDLIVLSPGIDPERPEIRKAREAGIPVLGEMALALHYVDVPMVAVTGTNGKSTVTELIAFMLEVSGQKVFSGGNLGTPLSILALEPANYDAAVLEVSSFQLDTLRDFRPEVAVLLNITEDHLDRYTGMETYSGSKARIFKDMRAGVAVLNYADPRVRAIGKKLSIPVLWYDGGERGVIITEEALYFDGGVEINLEDFTLPGRHNRENLAAAILAARAMDVSWEAVRRAIRNFKGLGHRMTLCGTVDGIACFNDSKATNMDAVRRALSSFDQKVVLIMGGRDKGGDYRLMRESVQRYAKKIILIGEAADLIEKAFCDLVCCERADTLEAAVKKALAAADPATPVVLSPACSSFDMFSDYKDRGNQFCKIVNELGRKGRA